MGRDESGVSVVEEVFWGCIRCCCGGCMEEGENNNVNIFFGSCIDDNNRSFIIFGF